MLIAPSKILELEQVTWVLVPVSHPSVSIPCLWLQGAQASEYLPAAVQMPDSELVVYGTSGPDTPIDTWYGSNSDLLSQNWSLFFPTNLRNTCQYPPDNLIPVVYVIGARVFLLDWCLPLVRARANLPILFRLFFYGTSYHLFEFQHAYSKLRSMHFFQLMKVIW